MAGPASAQSALWAEIVERVQRPCLAEIVRRQGGVSGLSEAEAVDVFRRANRRLWEENLWIMEGMLRKRPRSEHDRSYPILLRLCLDEIRGG